MIAECLVCDRTCEAAEAEACGWQRGECTCSVERCPTGAVWLCPEHRTEAA